MPTLLRDLRYAFRNLRNARGFALVAAVTLAIGIGANTAIFSIIDAGLAAAAAVSQFQPASPAERDRVGAGSLSVRGAGFRGLEGAKQHLSGHDFVCLAE